MGKHRISLGRRGVAALAAAGALVIGGATASMMGTGTAAPLDALGISSPTNTIVLPDLAPFKAADVRGTGKGEVSDEVGAPTGGGKAAFRLSTPTGDDKASYSAEVSATAAKPLAAWIPTAAYSAFKIAGGAANQFPSLQLVVDFNGAAEGGFSTLTYEPVYNPDTDSLEPGQWNRYQAGTGNWCSTRAIPGVIEEAQRSCSNGGAKPLSDYVAGAPDIVVNNVVINQGSGNPGVESAVDLITTPTATYDFELTKPVVVVPTTDPTSTTPTTKPGNGNGGGNNGGHPGNGGGNDGNHPGNGGGNNGNWGENGHCGC